MQIPSNICTYKLVDYLYNFLALFGNSPLTFLKVSPIYFSYSVKIFPNSPHCISSLILLRLNSALPSAHGSSRMRLLAWHPHTDTADSLFFEKRERHRGRERGSESTVGLFVCCFSGCFGCFGCFGWPLG